MDGRLALLTVRCLFEISWLQSVWRALMNYLLAHVYFACIFEPVLA